MIEIIPNWHPVFVHFTVALLSISILFFVLVYVLKTHPWREQWLTVAQWNLWLGCGFTIATAIAGWLAYNSVAHDTPSHAAMTDHRNWAIATIVVAVQLTIWSLSLYRAEKKPTLTFMIVALLALGLLMSTAWRGGEVVYRYGLGVMSLPNAEGDGHDHEHGEGHGHDSNSVSNSDNNHGDDSSQDAMNDMDMDFSGMDEFIDEQGSSKEGHAHTQDDEHKH